jgi:hypothetical protein
MILDQIKNILETFEKTIVDKKGDFAKGYKTAYGLYIAGLMQYPNLNIHLENKKLVLENEDLHYEIIALKEKLNKQTIQINQFEETIGYKDKTNIKKDLATNIKGLLAVGNFEEIEKLLKKWGA